MRNSIFFIFIFLGVSNMNLTAQSFEYYAGHQRTGVDIMWFKYFKDQENQATPWLLFSRNRASVDYHDSPSLFGSTNAISYNFKNGIGVVGVASFLNNGFTPKLGFQYYHQNNNLMFFGWVVADLEKHGNIDVFGMLRYQPKFNQQWSLFGQLEFFPVYNPHMEIWNITHRFRFGPKYKYFAWGIMMDLNQTRFDTWTSSKNFGGFLRSEF